MEPVHRVATITVGANSRQWLERSLRSLLASDQTGIALRFYYVDNGSCDGSGDLVRHLFPTVEVIDNGHNVGFAAGNNVGIRRALKNGADHVFLVNPDTECPPKLIGALSSFLEAWPEYGIVGPMQFQYGSAVRAESAYNQWSEDALANGEGHAFVMDWPEHPSHSSPTQGRAPNTLEHAYIQGAAFYIRADVLRTVGLFDEVFHTYYEDVELCRRARLAGWRVALVTNLGLAHKGAGDTDGTRFRRVHMLRNKYYYLATDIDWPILKAARLALRWLKNDIRGRSAGGRSSVPIAVVETVGAAMWLMRKAPTILNRRHANRRLRHRAFSARTQGSGRGDNGPAGHQLSSEPSGES